MDTNTKEIKAFEEAVKNYPWESEVQKEGYLNFVQFEKKFGKAPSLPIDNIVAYFIQKDHESNEYWRELVANQVEMLQEEIMRLRDEVKNLSQSLKEKKT